MHTTVGVYARSPEDIVFFFSRLNIPGVCCQMIHDKNISTYGVLDINSTTKIVIYPAGRHSCFPVHIELNLEPEIFNTVVLGLIQKLGAAKNMDYTGPIRRYQWSGPEQILLTITTTRV